MRLLEGIDEALRGVQLAAVELEYRDARVELLEVRRGLPAHRYRLVADQATADDGPVDGPLHDDVRQQVATGQVERGCVGHGAPAAPPGVRTATVAINVVDFFAVQQRVIGRQQLVAGGERCHGRGRVGGQQRTDDGQGDEDPFYPSR